MDEAGERRNEPVKIKIGSKPVTNVHEDRMPEVDAQPPVRYTEPVDKKEEPPPAEAVYVRPEPKFNILHNCSTCAFSTWDPKGERDMYSCRNQHSKYFQHSFCKGSTYARDSEKCWHPRGVYTIGDFLQGDPK